MFLARYIKVITICLLIRIDLKKYSTKNHTSKLILMKGRYLFNQKYCYTA
jgi:hypothetical protein